MAYLFTHFTSGEGGDREQIWFSVSSDGLHWKDLGKDGDPVLASEVGTKGIRDPFIVYDERLKKYFILGTDLNTSSGNWDAFASRGSRSLLVWESEDLINWSEVRLCEVGIKGAGCVWAPEAVFCEERNAWFVFWASNVKEKPFEKRKQRIYGAFTEDFATFTPTFKFMDEKTGIIDTNIVRCDGWYYRTSKDETNKTLIFERCRKLIPDEENAYERISSPVLDGFFGLEGPEVYYLRDMGKWCLMADQYHGNKGYLPMLTDDLSSGDFETLSSDKYDLGARKKRHGGIMEITDELAQMLEEELGVTQ